MSSYAKMDGNAIYLMVMACLVATFNAGTQGYDSSVMNSLQILPSYSEYFKLTTSTTSLNVSIVFVGCVIAAPFTGIITDRWGRKWGIAITAVLAIVGAIIQSAAVHEAMFCIGRLIIGLSITTGSTAAPTYVAEVAHPKHRVLLSGLCGATWYVGSVIAAAITYGTQYIDSTWSWRLPSLLQIIASVLCLIPLPFLPESPRWLIYNDRHEEARQILVKYHGNGDPDSPLVYLEYEEILQTLQYEKSVQKTEFKALVATKGNRWRIGVCVAIAAFTQLGGSNIITYYFGSALTTAGITSVQTQLGINLGMSVFCLVCAVLGSIFIDNFGRRPSLLTSTLSMSMFLIIIAVLTKFYMNNTSVAGSAAQILIMFLFNGSYAFVWTPVAFLYPLEILSFSLRANGIAVLNAGCFLAAFFNTYAIPYAMAWSSWGYYLITAIWVIVEAAIIYYYFPETKGLTLEEIDSIFDGETHADVDLKVGEVLQIKEVITEKA